MKTTLLRAALFALSIGSIPPAFAGEGGPTDNPSQAFVALAQVNTAPSGIAATAQSGQAVQAFVTQSNHGTWLYRPAQNGND